MTQNVPVAGLQVPALQTSSIAMTFQSAFGLYNLYAASTTLNIYQLANTNVKFDVSVGNGSSLVADSFKNTNQLPTTCSTLVLVSSTSTTSTSTSSSISTTSAAAPPGLIVPNGSTLPPGASSYGCYVYVPCHPPYHKPQISDFPLLLQRWARAHTQCCNLQKPFYDRRVMCAILR